MNSYLMYLVLAAVTISIPGPGVILTISNATHRGLAKSFVGMVGISLGVLLVAAISATSLGVLLASSALAFSVVKYMGAVYLVYLGVKMWRSSNRVEVCPKARSTSGLKCFSEGILLSLSNPKSIVFFMSIFAQFIDPSQGYARQFALLAITFGALILFIHTIYALTVVSLKARVTQYGRSLAINKVGGGLLVGFGVSLAASSKSA